jgi:hypothetical protein
MKAEEITMNTSVPNIIVLARYLGPDFETLGQLAEFLGTWVGGGAPVEVEFLSPRLMKIDNDRRVINITTGSRASSIKFTFPDGTSTRLLFPITIRVFLDLMGALTTRCHNR